MRSTFLSLAGVISLAMVANTSLAQPLPFCGHDKMVAEADLGVIATRVATKELAIDKALKVEVKSSPVEHQGRTYHLIDLHDVRFKLDEQGHLSAKASGTITSFDNVNYRIHAAVFDRKGQLVGTASADVEVPRLWVGYVVRGNREIALDFGISTNYAGATSFTIAVSQRNVLTPDQW